MKITGYNGKTLEELKETFTCGKCGCDYEAEHGEYIVSTNTISSYCPACKRKVTKLTPAQEKVDSDENSIYYIENTIDERRVRINGFFTTLEAAKEALKDCSDWWRETGTGKIYRVQFGLNERAKLVYQN